MVNSQSYPPIRKRSPLRLLFLLVLLGCCFACEEDFDLPVLDDFTKAERERFGELLETAFLELPQNTVLPDTGRYVPVYALVQALYDQASNAYRRDVQAADRWTADRAWTVTITTDDAATLRAFPGGRVVLSTGLLRQLTQEYELYHLLSIEATLVQEGLLLEQLVADYGLESLELIAGADRPETLSVFQNLATAYPTLPLAPERLAAADPRAQAHICMSSLYAPFGAVLFLEKFGEAAYYQTRPAYGGRLTRLRAFSGDNCGTLEGNGSYASRVLANL